MGAMKVDGVSVKRVGDMTRLDDSKVYVAVGEAKDDRSRRVAFRGTYDEAAAYAERNESPDNYERYFVAEVVPGEVFTVEAYGDGFTICANGSWGIGHVFKHRAYAESACRTLNDNVALDAADGVVDAFATEV